MRLRSWILSIGLTCFLLISARMSPMAQPLPKPKLVVGIVVDQMRADYLYRYWDKLGDSGFKRLMGEGFVCDNTTYTYVPTYTAPGHASIFTGTTPAVHGIVGNAWYDRQTDQPVYCTDDKQVQAVGGTPMAGMMSPRNMLSTTITDELRIATNFKSTVIGIALKDRGAILPAGHMANGAYWYDARTGQFMSSTHYGTQLPAWVTQFNKRGLALAYMSKPWTPFLPLPEYTASLADDSPYELKNRGETNPVFPHDLPKLVEQQGLGVLSATPFGNTLTREFAVAAIQAEQLGKREVTDFLTLSFSSPDYVGHQYGPHSIEIEDTYLRLDREIAEFLSFLDSYLGKNNVLIFLTADHGAANVPAYLAARKVPAGYFEGKALMRPLKAYLHQLYGDSLVINYSNQQIYLDQSMMAQKKLDPTQVQTAVATFLQSTKGLAGILSADAIQHTSFTDPIRNLVQNGYNLKRSGDVMLTLEPGWMEYQSVGTTHGSAYSYDTRVPLIWYGWQIPVGRTAQAVSISDIAPTLAIMLHTAFPNGTTGQPLPFLIR